MQTWQNEYIWINILELKYLTLKLITVKEEIEMLSKLFAINIVAEQPNLKRRTLC